ncbi:predicted protein [Sclerotinia sclerotiorum 1980 UF-70]|uniref:SnoaL-like domain-containing protein n=2 Tax=Sclerotinia sclerotiorum (strain ATCC 18683 / 1980 / Ss-1) TaxID=665079 RepID=A7EPV7_SCLS1|nr:predicted protein [Sclerotinia sclerotiorum 1980 UF-70]APA10212.1 hypothetical protein sscle_06g049820 [Sclerotinia sclerotiorum 1980 UF-70]EDO04873.1 predicted protein [Sclerotinia sclerotiorum 1980 UF-70]
MHTYKSVYPDGIQVQEGIKEFWEGFYGVSDLEGEEEEGHLVYADQFTEDAVLVMGVKRVRGREEILAFRKSMWEKVASRLHTVHKIFSFGQDSTEVMLFGNVAYGLKDGRKADVEWAGRAKLVQEGGKWKLGFYQVYLDSAAVQNAK